MRSGLIHFISIWILVFSDDSRLQKIGVTGAAKRNACSEDNDVSLLNVAGSFGCFCGVEKKDFHAVFFLDQNRGDSPGHIQLSAGMLFRRASDDQASRTVFGYHAGGISGTADGDDGLGSQVNGRHTGRVGNSGCHVGRMFSVEDAELLVIGNISFCTDGNLYHGAESFHRVFAGSSLAGKHDGAGSLIDRIGNVRCLRTGGTGILDHGIQHR